MSAATSPTDEPAGAKTGTTRTDPPGDDGHGDERHGGDGHGDERHGGDGHGDERHGGQRVPTGAVNLARGALHTSAHLAVVAGPDSGWVVGLAGPGVVIGRGEGSDLRLHDPSMSRQHLLVRTRGVRIQARDLSSVNGTRWRPARPHHGRRRPALAGSARFRAAAARPAQAAGTKGSVPVRWRRRTRRLGHRWQQVWPGDLLHLGGTTLQIRPHPSLHRPMPAPAERSPSDGVLPRLILPLLMTAGMIPMLATSQAGPWRTGMLVLMPIGLLVAVLWPVLSERRRKRRQPPHSAGPGRDGPGPTERDYAHRSDPASLLLFAQSAAPGLRVPGAGTHGPGADSPDRTTNSALPARHVAPSPPGWWDLGAGDLHSPPHLWSLGAWQDVPAVPVPAPGTGLALLGEPAAVDALARYLMCQYLVHNPDAGVQAPEPWTWIAPFADRSECVHSADPGSVPLTLRVCDARTPGMAVAGAPGAGDANSGEPQPGGHHSGEPPPGGNHAGERQPGGHRSVDPDSPDPLTIHIVLARHLGQVPPWCTRIVEVRTNHDRLVSAEWAQALLTVRARIGRASAIIPDEVSITGLLGPTDPDSIMGSWRITDGALAADIGIDDEGPVRLDLVRDGPHAVVAGTTGSGKSELLLSWVLALACRYPPGEVAFLLVDYKGGATFGPIRSLPQVLGLLTDLDGAATSRALASLRAELQRREHLLAQVGAANLEEYRSRTASTPSARDDPLPRLMVIVDEFRAMSDEHPEHLDDLVRLAAQGRSLGIHLVLATQRPAGAINADMRANLTARVCLRVLEDADSLDTIGTAVAAQLPARPGRAVLRTQQTTTFQAAWCGTPESLRGLVHHVSEAGARLFAAEPWRADLPAPWAPPLPTAISLDDLHALRADKACRPPSGGDAHRGPRKRYAHHGPRKGDAHGGPTKTATAHIVEPEPLAPGQSTARATSDDPSGTCLVWLRTDLPAQQRLGLGTVVLPARVLISGPPGSGRSTAAAALAETALQQGVPVHTLAGSELAPAVAPAAGTYCPVTDPRRAHRLLTMLATTRAPALLIVDDVETWTDTLDEYAGPGGGLDLLTSLLRQSRRLGLSMVITATTPAHRWAGSVDQHLLLAPRDPAEAVLAGVPKELTGTGWPPGRGVLLSSQDPVLCQVAMPTAQAGAQQWPEPAATPLRLSPLPDGVTLEQPHSPGLHRLWLGVGGDDAQWVSAPLPPGGTWLIAGTPGTGRSTTLAMLQAQVRAHDRTDVHFIDDADRLDAAELARLETALRDPDASVIATAHPERLLNAYHELGARLRESATLLAFSPVSSHLAGTDIRAELDIGTPGRGVLVHGGKVLPLQVARLPD